MLKKSDKRKKRNEGTPTCLACGATFSRNSATMSCSSCGIKDEAASSPSSIRRWKINNNLLRPNISTSNRRRRQHGVPRSHGRVKGGSHA